MVSTPVRAVVVAAVGGGVLVAGALPAAAVADPRASCVATVTSTLAPQGALDVDEFKALAEALGAPNFGQFVRGGAQEHFGNLEECIPPAP